MIKGRSCYNCQHFTTCIHAKMLDGTFVSRAKELFAEYNYINEQRVAVNFYFALGDSCDEYLEIPVSIGLIDK